MTSSWLAYIGGGKGEVPIFSGIYCFSSRLKHENLSKENFQTSKGITRLCQKGTILGIPFHKGLSFFLRENAEGRTQRPKATLWHKLKKKTYYNPRVRVWSSITMKPLL